MNWSEITRRLTERWRIVGGYAVASSVGKLAYDLTRIMTDEPIWHVAMLGFWATVFFSCWWNIWKLMSTD